MHRAWRAPTLQQRVSRDRHSASHAKVENCVGNEGDLVASNLNSVLEVPMTHVNFIIIVVKVADRKK
jgi:hypothetical protein